MSQGLKLEYGLPPADFLRWIPAVAGMSGGKADGWRVVSTVRVHP